MSPLKNQCSSVLDKTIVPLLRTEINTWNLKHLQIIFEPQETEIIFTSKCYVYIVELVRKWNIFTVKSYCKPCKYQQKFRIKSIRASLRVLSWALFFFWCIQINFQKLTKLTKFYILTIQLLWCHIKRKRPLRSHKLNSSIFYTISFLTLVEKLIPIRLS